MILLVAFSSTSLAWAAEQNPWPSFETPFEGPPRAIGDYSKGCVQGALPLALDGAGYQVMRPSRRRYYGHPDLLSFIETLGRRVQESGTVLLVGDLSQPRGGRSNSGHSSHQTGLDVDIWYWHPPAAKKRSLSTRQRERTVARTVVDPKHRVIMRPWAEKVERVLRFASADQRVARIFVNPIIKRVLCQRRGDHGYLRKVRPWYGHDDHFHVRLGCPKDSAQCIPQADIPAGDGCGALAFWFDEKAQAARKKAQSTYQKNVDEGRGWPAACEPLLK
jgi:penicillin-insensitive murein endopeptidase